ncbi:MAG: hypothetical protein IJ491_00720 [Clostridia bacterium]|nr:hypothetical protein [Clostridia bacterium]
MTVNITEKSYIIENQFFKKEIFTNKKRIASGKITNKLSGSYLDGLDRSEEFLIQFKCGFSSQLVKASELKIKKADTEAEGTVERLIITFKSIRIRNSDVVIKVVYEASQTDKFYKKYIDISFKKQGKKKIILDFIELADTEFGTSLNSWCLPEQKKSHMPGIALSLGQPVYVDSFYFGCEFPAAYSTIKDNTVSVRTYSGKTLGELIKDGSFKSYKYVCGVAESDNFAEVQKSFFSYIRGISKPVKLRIQYNSWFDNMLNITEENVTSSFLEVDKGLTGYGVKPIDSFVVDDGWNDYGKGFWTFNSKFPERLTPFMNLSEALGSRFGVWVGPRGGYTNDTIKFARHIQNAGNGYVNKSARDICVASDKYSRKTGDMLLEFMDSFHLNYFKLDGFAQFPCKNKRHDHMVGGYKNMYFYTDVWEKWLNIFEKMGEKGGNDLWINLTCYAPPSAWFLQWVNSVWMQISDDIGFIGSHKEVSDKDRMLSYRDERYFDFYRNRQFQFPQSCLYNHDPIYGNEAKVKMTDDEFRDYLFTMATRGTAFWELYYSHSMMNEAKWRINRSVLGFLEDNMEVLSNSVIFGGRPSLSQVYGFSCFNEAEGIVSVRNSSDKQMEYSLRLDENIGVGRLFKKSGMTTVLPYTTEQVTEKYGYGDTLTVTLKPYETKIFHFNKPLKLLKVDYVKSINENELEVSFNQFVNVGSISCDENKIKSVKLLEDYMTAVVTFENGFGRENKLTLNGVSDIMGNSADITLNFDYYENNIVVYGISGNTDFSVKATLDGEKPCVLMKQGGELLLEVCEDGYVRFKVGLDELRSRKTVKDVVQVTAVRERNGVLKLYLNGTLDSGKKSLNTHLSGENAYCYDSGKVKLYNKALAFDEV